MPRLKPEQPLTFYHVMTRTAQKSFLLSEEHDPGLKAIVDRIIKSLAEVFYVRIFAHVCMSNHYHIALSVSQPELDTADLQARFEKLQALNAYPQKWQPWFVNKVYRRFTDLSCFMAEVNRRIAVAHNKRHDTAGHFWGGRFKSKIIEDEDALLRVVTYIEQNPVRANLCAHPSEYPWCSAGQARRALERGEVPVLPNIGPIQHRDDGQRARLYVDWMDIHADLLRGEPSMAQPPQSVSAICLSQDALSAWRKDFLERNPSDWGSQAYGSMDFQEAIAAKVKARRLVLARRSTQQMRTGPRQTKPGNTTRLKHRPMSPQ